MRSEGSGAEGKGRHGKKPVLSAKGEARRCAGCAGGSPPRGVSTGDKGWGCVPGAGRGGGTGVAQPLSAQVGRMETAFLEDRERLRRIPHL